MSREHAGQRKLNLVKQLLLTLVADLPGKRFAQSGQSGAKRSLSVVELRNGSTVLLRKTLRLVALRGGIEQVSSEGNVEDRSGKNRSVRSSAA